MLGFSKTSVSNPELLTKKLESAPDYRRQTVHNWENGAYWLCSTEYSHGPFNTSHFYEDDQWIMLFDGDLINHPQIPWLHFRQIMESDKLDQFSELVGIWSLAVINKESRNIYLVSDRLSQFPCFYSVQNGLINFATELHVFCRLIKKATFNQSWLHDSLYFQYAIGEKTFLQDVYRLPSASVLIFEQSTQELSIYKYCDDFSQSDQLKTGKQALTHAFKVFNSQLPSYIPENFDSAIGLTAGLDARTVLAFNIKSKPLTYTYGQPGCSDITTAQKAAASLGLNHKVIPFDNKLEILFTNLILDVVHLSGGLENSSRASVLYSYREVTDNGTRHPLLASGIGLDSIFRGHLGPALVSPALAEYFRGKTEVVIPAFLNEIILDKQAFNMDVKSSIQSLRNRYGPLENGLAHLLYFVYEAAPKYFGGEVSIARYFTKLRIPSLNQHIINLAFSIDKSALSYSNFLSTHTRDNFAEKELQAYLLSKASEGQMGQLPVYDVPPNAFRYGEFSCNTIKKWASAKRLGGRIFLRNKRPPTLEQNIDLYKTTARKRIHELLYSEDTLIKKYINIPEFDILVSPTHQHLFKVIITTEIIMRLIETRWERFW